MCEVRAIYFINSRPLTTVSGDLEPLTPNHIYITKSTVILLPSGKFWQISVGDSGKARGWFYCRRQLK